MTSELDRTTVRRLKTMLDANLVTHRDLQPWAESALRSVEAPPVWLWSLATQTYSADVSQSLREYLWPERFDVTDCAEVDDEYIGSLYLRFERHELSWATFLALAGEYADRAEGAWVCEELFKMLDELEDAEFSPVLARGQQIRIENTLSAAIGRMRVLYKEVRIKRRPDH